MKVEKAEQLNRRHKSVTLPVLVVMASAIAAGCGQQQQCVDSNGHALPDNACRSSSSGYYHYPHWIYRSGGGFGGGSIGTTVRGGFGGWHGGFGGGE